MIKLLASHHARQRARQRIGWRRRTLDRMLERIFYDGLGEDECTRRLSDYIAATTDPDAGLTRIYGEHIYVFGRARPDEIVLLTVYQLPPEFRSIAHAARRQHHALAA